MEKAEVIKAFHLMWDNYPESAMLIDKKRNIIAANKSRAQYRSHRG